MCWCFRSKTEFFFCCVYSRVIWKRSLLNWTTIFWEPNPGALSEGNDFNQSEVREDSVDIGLSMQKIWQSYTTDITQQWWGKNWIPLVWTHGKDPNYLCEQDQMDWQGCCCVKQKVNNFVLLDHELCFSSVDLVLWPLQALIEYCSDG